MTLRRRRLLSCQAHFCKVDWVYHTCCRSFLLLDTDSLSAAMTAHTDDIYLRVFVEGNLGIAWDGFAVYEFVGQFLWESRLPFLWLALHYFLGLEL